eukprot:TRINITY_DN90819_c0_g1_i1.p1 TRINITY_DN90819_c0_g1~~TRINITY_DN90819_c0_g1_i1.p1  ORF type:complete len:868 (+),score=127.80 TRINITY_DN90819_c0_g1_i1:59-2662(+)
MPDDVEGEEDDSPISTKKSWSERISESQPDRCARVRRCCRCLCKCFCRCLCRCCHGGEGSNGRSLRREKFFYALDKALARRSRFFALMTLMGAIQVLACALLYFLTAVAEQRDFLDAASWDFELFSESLWIAWTFMADPGTQSDVELPWLRIVGSVISVSGIIFWSCVLAITVDLVRDKMEGLRQGKSRIIEQDHVLILGWTEKTVHIIEELCSANESEGGGVVAVLAPVSKETMELQLEYQLPTKHRKGTRVVFRSGSPLVVADLDRVSIHLAKAIIILATPGSADQADADTLRTMLSIRSSKNSWMSYVVAEVRDIDNEPLVKLVGGPMVETMVSHDFIGRLMLMSVRQPGLAKVYEGLLGFDGDEFYMSEWPELEGLDFGDLAEKFPEAIPIGVKTAEGRLILRPPVGYPIAKGDQIIVIAEDNDTYEPEEANVVEMGEAPAKSDPDSSIEHILFCGWRRDIRDILAQLDSMVLPGSEVHMMTHCIPLSLRSERLLDDGLDVNSLANLKIVHHFGNTSVRRKLSKLPITEYACCMIFADEAFEADTLTADSHSMATLLLIRDLQYRNRKREINQMGVPVSEASDPGIVKQAQSGMSKLTQGRQRCPIICEILDPHTQTIIATNAQLGLTSDFCQSNKLTAQVLAMVAEERTVNDLINELLGNHGCEIAVVPSSRYAHPDELTSFMVLQKRASRQFQELIIGYQQKDSVEKTVLNPYNKWKPCRWESHDLAILRGKEQERARRLSHKAKAEVNKPALASMLGGDDAVASLGGRSRRRPTKTDLHSPKSPAKSGADGQIRILENALQSPNLTEDQRQRLFELLDELLQLLSQTQASPANGHGHPVTNGSHMPAEQDCAGLTRHAEL